MVGVTCEKCGATYRFDDAAVAASGTIIKCSRCGHAITVMPPGSAATGGKPPASAAKKTTFGLGPGIVPKPGDTKRPPGPLQPPTVPTITPPRGAPVTPAPAA